MPSLNLLADGGSTKTHWQLRLTGGTVVREFITSGMNPSVMPEKQLHMLLFDELKPQLPEEPLCRVEYYGAGCRGEASRAMERALRSIVGDQAEFTVDSDMLGACRAMAGDRCAIVCILGTGANSCLYNGKEIVKNIPPLGYILGDEGSGAWLGKRLVADVLKGILPKEITSAFFAAYPITPDEIIRRTYRPDPLTDKAPNRFLAQFAHFVGTHIAHRQVEEIVTEGFDLFFRRNILRYFADNAAGNAIGTPPGELPIMFVGSVAASFAPQLHKVAAAHGLAIAEIRRSPLAH